MDASNIPASFLETWAQNGLRNVVPLTTTTVGAASIDQGFPPVTMIPIASGGIPPSGKDMNGALNLVSAWAQWYNAGGPVVYNAAFSSAIGGYPKGALIQSAVTPEQFWLSTIDNNLSDPDAGGAGWEMAAFMTVSSLLTVFTAMVAALPTTTPSVAGTVWNNDGVISVSVP